MKVLIDFETRKKLAALGVSRNSAKRPEWTRRKSDVFNDQQVDILGCIGEFAASIAIGAPMNLDVHSHGDGGVDLNTAVGTIAVKFNHRNRGYLIVEERSPDRWSDLNSDILVLVHGLCSGRKGECVCSIRIKSKEPMEVIVAGYIEASKFKNIAKHVDWGLGGRFFCDIDSLRPVHELRNLLVAAGVTP